MTVVLSRHEQLCALLLPAQLRALSIVSAALLDDPTTLDNRKKHDAKVLGEDQRKGPACAK